jgi:mannose-6-phosphate isomerase-like protein (cupin superfamily)
MSDYTVCRLEEAEDVMGGRYPGEMRFLTQPLGTEQVALTYRRMPKGAGGRGGYGHRHRTQEEVYFVMGGTLTFKLGDEIREVPAGTAVRVAPHVVRSVHNDHDEEVELVIVSTRVEDLRAEGEIVEGFWAE